MDLITRRTLEAKVVYAENGMPRRVLYAEDDPVTRELNYSILSVMGFYVDAVEDGQSAIELAHQNPYDFLVLDLDLPLADGYEVARQVRTGVGQSKNAKILALSGFANAADSQSKRNSHIDGFLLKPTSRQGIRAAVLKMMEKEQQFPVFGRKLLNPPSEHVPHKTLPALETVSRPPLTDVKLQSLPAVASVPAPLPVIAAAPAPVPVIAQIPTAMPAPQNWRHFGTGLPEDFAQIVEKLAIVQAHAYIVDLSHGFKARDDRAILKARKDLNRLAMSFEMFDIIRLLSLNVGATIGQQCPALFTALAAWQAARFKLAQAA